MGIAGDDKVKKWLFPQQLFPQRVIGQHKGVLIQILGKHVAMFSIIRIADIVFIAHCRVHDAAAVKGRGIVVEGIGGISCLAEQVWQALRESIAAVGKGQIAVCRGKYAGIHGKFRVEGTDTAV